MKVVNEDGASITTKVAVKQLHYMTVTLRLKHLYLSGEIAKQMKWHKEGKCDSEDHDIMSHILPIEMLGRPWISLIQNLQRTPALSVLSCR
jgi:hypothetical protein